MGLFAKLREGLTKTRDSLMGRVDTLVKETRKIDEDFYEELEDILLMSDCGMKATTAMMDELRRRVSENKVKDADTAKQGQKRIKYVKPIHFNFGWTKFARFSPL